MKNLLFVIAIAVISFNCKKDTARHKQTIFGITPVVAASVPYKGGETITFYSDSFNLATQTDITEGQWLTSTSDTVYKGETIHFVAEYDSNPFFMSIDIGGGNNYIIFKIFPVLGKGEGTGTEIELNAISGEFICNGYRNVFNDTLTLNSFLFHDVVTLNTYDYYAPQIYYSKQYGIIGYSAPGGKIFAIKP
jgi:hypothetical protein